MNHFKRQFTLWTAALCLLLTAAVTPVLSMAQTSPSDTSNADAAKQAKKRIKKDKAAAVGKAAADSSAKPRQEGPGSSQSPGPSPMSVPAKSSLKAAHTPTDNAADADIAAAKASGKVWVNLDSGIYHKSGRWYGRTKNGKFMTEAEAKTAGYKGSQRD